MDLLGPDRTGAAQWSLDIWSPTF